MLQDQAVVFLSCSDKYLRPIALPLRVALADSGVRGIILSVEPFLPHTGWEPDNKLERI